MKKINEAALASFRDQVEFEAEHLETLREIRKNKPIVDSEIKRLLFISRVQHVLRLERGIELERRQNELERRHEKRGRRLSSRTLVQRWLWVEDFLSAIYRAAVDGNVSDLEAFVKRYGGINLMPKSEGRPPKIPRDDPALERKGDPGSAGKAARRIGVSPGAVRKARAKKKRD